MDQLTPIGAHDWHGQHAHQGKYRIDAYIDTRADVCPVRLVLNTGGAVFNATMPPADVRRIAALLIQAADTIDPPARPRIAEHEHRGPGMTRPQLESVLRAMAGQRQIVVTDALIATLDALAADLPLGSDVARALAYIYDSLLGIAPTDIVRSDLGQPAQIVLNYVVRQAALSAIATYGETTAPDERPLPGDFVVTDALLQPGANR